jgi:urease accessory protein
VIALNHVIAIALCLFCLLTIQPALAHHPMGGRNPVNFVEGFLSGLGHPIIGLDHFAFIIAVGLLAVLRKKLGILIPLAFTVTTGLGTLIHVQSIDLPIPEVIIALSVLIIGIVLALQKNFNLILLVTGSAIAGIFHGFAYGEAIFGAETTPLGAYLFGFVVIQLLISAIAFYLGRLTIKNVNKNSSLALSFAGCVIAGIGISFLSGALLG